MTREPFAAVLGQSRGAVRPDDLAVKAALAHYDPLHALGLLRGRGSDEAEAARAKLAGIVSGRLISRLERTAGELATCAGAHYRCDPKLVLAPEHKTLHFAHEHIWSANNEDHLIPLRCGADLAPGQWRQCLPGTYEDEGFMVCKECDALYLRPAPAATVPLAPEPMLEWMATDMARVLADPAAFPSEAEAIRVAWETCARWVSWQVADMPGASVHMAATWAGNKVPRDATHWRFNTNGLALALAAAVPEHLRTDCRREPRRRVARVVWSAMRANRVT